MCVESIDQIRLDVCSLVSNPFGFDKKSLDSIESNLALRAFLASKSISLINTVFIS